MDIPVANAIFWIAVACCAVAQIAIIRSALVTPVIGHTGEPLPRPRRPIEVLWTVLPAVALAILLYYTWHAIHERRPASAHTAVASVTAISIGLDAR